MTEGSPEQPKVPKEENASEIGSQGPEREIRTEPKSPEHTPGANPEKNEGRERLLIAARASAEALKTFVTRVGLREKAGMDPFMDPSVRQLMHEAAQEFHNAGFGVKDDTDATLYDALTTTAAAFRKMEKQNTGTLVIENSRNLQALFNDLRPLHANIVKMEAEFQERHDSDSVVVAASVRKEVERIGDFLNRLYAAAARYERR